jgi:hypothetical protein
VDIVEDFANDVKRRNQVGAAVAYKQSDGFAYLGSDGVVASECTHFSVKNDVLSVFIYSFLHIKGL